MIQIYEELMSLDDSNENSIRFGHDYSKENQSPDNQYTCCMIC